VWKEYTAQDPMVEIPLSQIPNGVFDPQIGVWYEIRTVVGNMVSNVIYGKQTMDEAIKEATQKIEEYLKEEEE